MVEKPERNNEEKKEDGIVFLKAEHSGEMESPDAFGEATNPACGDVITFFLRIRGGVIEQVRYHLFGCPPLASAAEIVSRLVEGKAVGNVARLTLEDIKSRIPNFKNLEESDEPCMKLPLASLSRALEDYERKRQGRR